MTAATGWYPDPAGTPGAFRYWDGAAWSEATATDPWADPSGAGAAGQEPATLPAAWSPGASAPYPPGVPPYAVGQPGYPGGQSVYPGGPYAAPTWVGPYGVGPYGIVNAPVRRSRGEIAAIAVAIVAIVALIVGGVIGVTRRGVPTPTPAPSTARTATAPATPRVTSTPISPPGASRTAIPAAVAPGSVWAWGARAFGNGAPSYPGPETPVVAALADIVQVSGGDWGALAVDAAGTVWAWGSNYDSQLGVPDERAGDFPVHVPGLPPVKAVESGYGASFAVAQDGTVWAWGRSYQGRLGDGRDDEFTQVTPAQITGLTDVVQVASGYSNGFALTADGEVWAWGAPWTSGLGGSSFTTVVPTLIPGLSDVVAIDATFAMAFALTADGTVWGWGFADQGELCIDTGDRSAGRTPTRLAVPPAAGIGAGDEFTVVALRDGSVVTCGRNDNGQLGDGTTDASSVPVAVPGLSGIVQVSAGDTNGYAVDSTGAVWAWGDNRWHQIGDGTTMVRYSPVAVPGLTGIAAVSAGSDAVYALQG